MERIERAILVIRGHKVLLDTDLAVLYGVETKALNRAVKRNVERFPADFMFQLTEEEAAALRRHYGTSNTGNGSVLRSQFGTLNGRGGRRTALQGQIADAHDLDVANLKELGFRKG